MDLRLDDRAVIAVSGPAAGEFLQGLVTNDVGKVDAASLSYAALLTPQGKILFDFLIGRDRDAFVLDCHRASRDALAKRLTLYRLRAPVEIAATDDLAVVWRAEAPIDQPFLRDPRHEALGARAIMPVLAAPQDVGDRKFAEVRLRLGVPEGPDFGQDRIFALDGDLDELHGIAFDKGCYVGQELTARMKHRGTARKRLLKIVTASGHALPEPGTAITAEARELGTIQATHGSTGFALIRLDRLAEADGARLNAADTNVIVQKPSWLAT